MAITPNTPNPVREDSYTTELATKLGIDPKYIPKSPVWRNEEEIAAIAEMFSNMAGGSSGGGVLVVHGTYDEQAGTITLDKTFNDLLTAVNAGKIPVYIGISGEDNASAMYFNAMYVDLKYLVSFMTPGSDGAVDVIEFAADTADDYLVCVAN